MLVEIDVWKNAHLWYRENGRIVYRKEEFIPWFIVSGIENLLEEIESLDMPGVLRIERKRFRSVGEENEGVAIYVRPYNFFTVANTVDRYYNFHRARLYNVDIRFSVRFMAEKGIFPYMDGRERFIPMGSEDLEILEFKRHGNNLILDGRYIDPLDYSSIEKIVESLDPDIIIMPGADENIKKMVEIAKKRDEEFNLGRNRGWRTIGEKEYFSYGREYYRTGALVPIGRSLVDPETSFIYKEGGIEGLLTVSRISSIPISIASRSTPGTLVSTMEVYEALRRGIAVPLHKYNAESEKTLETLVLADRGGIVYQPRAGLYFNVSEIDFTSMYPSIIVRKNLSLETVNSNCFEYELVPEIGYKVCRKRGFLPEALSPLLNLRIKTKALKKSEARFKGIDSALKWMLVTSFGYTGYRNAKFGSIEVHEAINAYAREYFLRAKEILESHGYDVIHGIVDSIMVEGEVGDEIIADIEEATSIPLEVSERYLWVKILPEKNLDLIGSPGKYMGLKSNGEFKLRGIMLRRQDAPKLIKKFQEECLDILRSLKNEEMIDNIREKLFNKFVEYSEAIETRRVRNEDLLIEKRVSRYPYQYVSRTAMFSVLMDLYDRGEIKRPGETIRYLVYSTRPIRAVDETRIMNVDYSIKYYLSILRDAYNEILV
ncbi:MAG: type B DNA-directed DNA polymerase [Thermoplasmata archaeon]|nr:type B DNA-directed DNA polymerase [Euryarchaeota archaeon]MVT35738.1 type B DNA-directed DNA polymerase [Euryarchaeota archaeon]